MLTSWESRTLVLLGFLVMVWIGTGAIGAVAHTPESEPALTDSAFDEAAVVSPSSRGLHFLIPAKTGPRRLTYARPPTPLGGGRPIKQKRHGAVSESARGVLCEGKSRNEKGPRLRA